MNLRSLVFYGILFFSKMTSEELVLAMSTMQDSPDIPRILLDDHSGIAWELWRGNGLPDPCIKEWNTIVSLFTNKEWLAQKHDKVEIINFLKVKLSILG